MFFKKKRIEISPEKRELFLAVIQKYYEEQACCNCKHFTEQYISIISNSHCRYKRYGEFACFYEPKMSLKEKNDKMCDELENILNDNI